MAFKKTGSPQDTISVHADGKTASFCPACQAMSESKMDKKAFVSGQPAGTRCGKCSQPIS